MVGDTYTILVSGADTAGRYTLIDMHVPPGGGPPPHRHDFEETFTVLDGEIELTFRGVSAVARAGETVNVPANAPHVFPNVSDRPARLLCPCSPPARRSSFRRSASPSATGPRRRRRWMMTPPPRSSPRRSRWPRSTAPSSCSTAQPLTCPPGATMSQQQRDDLDQLLRDGPLDLGGDVAEQRDIFEETMAAIPVPADVTTIARAPG